MSKPAPGRPKDSPNRKYDVVDQPISRCKQCGCQEREPYFKTEVHEIVGMTEEGVPYDSVVWRSTQCTECKQHRKDRSYEMRGNSKN